MEYMPSYNNGGPYSPFNKGGGLAMNQQPVTQNGYPVTHVNSVQPYTQGSPAGTASSNIVTSQCASNLSPNGNTIQLPSMTSLRAMTSPDSLVLPNGMASSSNMGLLNGMTSPTNMALQNGMTSTNNMTLQTAMTSANITLPNSVSSPNGMTSPPVTMTAPLLYSAIRGDTHQQIGDGPCSPSVTTQVMGTQGMPMESMQPYSPSPNTNTSMQNVNGFRTPAQNQTTNLHTLMPVQLGNGLGNHVALGSSSESDTSMVFRRPAEGLQPWEQELEIDISSPSSLSSFSSEYNSITDSMYIPSPSPHSHHPMNGDSMWPNPAAHGHIQVKIEDTSEASTTTHSPIHGLKKKQRCTSSGSGGGKGIEEELCLICGDRASGYHYNALSCEGCKGFFRRSITKGASYTCKYGGHCEMDMWMRRKCQSCRLRRCREVGMKEECLLSEDQCKARDARRKARQRLLKVQQPAAVGSTEMSVASPQDSVGSAEYKDGSPHTPAAPDEVGPVPDPLNYISTEERELIERVVYFQDKYELPSESDVKNIADVRISDLGRPQELSEQIYKNMAEMTILVTQLVVEFAKQLPGFSNINREDQIVLLKGSASEVMILRTARRYDLETDTIIFANGTPMTKESMRFGGLQDYVDGMFHFCQGMGKLAVDNAEYALLTALTILSERPGLTQPEKVEETADQYLHTLISYERWRRARKEHFLAKLLQKLTDLRTLSVEHADILFSLKVEKGSLPPLLSEYFDVV